MRPCSTKSSPAVTPHLGRTGKPVRRRGRWTFVSHQWNGDVWRLDDSAWDLEYDPLDGSAALLGCWVLYRDGRHDSPVDHYLDGAMEWAEEKFDRTLWEALGGTWPLT